MLMVRGGKGSPAVILDVSMWVFIAYELRGIVTRSVEFWASAAPFDPLRPATPFHDLTVFDQDDLIDVVKQCAIR